MTGFRRRPARACAAAVALGALVLGGCDHARRGIDASKEILVTLPGAYRRGSVAVARDGRGWALLEEGGLGVRVVANGAAYQTMVDIATPSLSADGRHVAWWGTYSPESEGARRVVILVVDGREHPTELARVGAIVMAPRGGRFAAAGEVRRPPDGAGAGEQAKDDAAAGNQAGRPRGRTTVLVDGAEAGRWKATTDPAFSPDGTRVAWLAAEDDGRIAVMVDGAVRTRLEPAGPEVAPAATTAKVFPSLGPQMAARWLADGSLLTLAPEPDGWVLARDGRRLGVWPVSHTERMGGVQMDFGDRFATVPAIAAGSLAVAEDAPVVAWWERVPGDPGGWRVVRDGTPVDDVVCASYLASQPPPVLSRDGRHVAYGCRLGGDLATPNAIVVVDGRRYGPHVEVFGVAMSETGVPGYAASDDPVGTSPAQWRYRIGERVLPEAYLEAWRPRLDAQGTRLAWEAAPEKQPYLGLDRVRISRFDQIFWGPEFVAPDEVAWVVRRGRKLARVSARF